jgi:predicted nucleic acid-binding Zn ribbon protein
MTTSNAPTYAFHRDCIECGTRFGTNVRAAKSCSTACRKAFNNRRMIRGAELYDLMMAHRFDRTSGLADEQRAAVYRLISVYRDADKALRGGRPSWDKQCLDQLPLGYSTAGDNR